MEVCMGIEVKTEIIANKYFIKIINIDAECEYHFNIHRDGKYITTLFSLDGMAEYELVDDGLYYCRVAMFKDGKKVGTRTSKVREFFSATSKRELKELISQITIEKDVLPLAYVPSQSPFCDICLIMKKVGDQYFKYSIDTNGKVYTFSDGSKIYFSGLIKYKNNLLTDISDIEQEIDFVDKLGSYFVITETTNRFNIFNDYFGEQKIFYYESSEWFICSNRYHFMLERMKDLQIKLELDIENCIMGFASSYAHFSENPINEKMNVKGIKFCPLEKRLAISSNGIEYINRKIYEDLYICLTVSDKYEELLQGVKNEIISNVKCCIHNSVRNNITVDLSGGYDSRLVFSAITNLADGKKIKVRTEAYPNMQDFSIATTIADDFDFEYDYELTQKFTGKKEMPYSLEEILNIDDSTQLGTYFGFADVLNSKGSSHNYLELWGTIGEAVTRPYITGGDVALFSKWGSTENDRMVLSDFMEITSRYIISDFDKVGNLFEENILNEMKKIEFKSSVHKLETLYLKYRNRFHCNIGLSCGFRVLQWQPLQSPKSLIVFHSSFDEFKYGQYAFDLLYKMNPYLTKYPFSSEVYNNEMKQLQSMLIFNGGKALFEIRENSTLYNKGLENFNASSSEDFEKINLNIVNRNNIKDINLYLLNRMLPSFALVMEYENGIFLERFGNSLWHICKNILRNSKDKFEINKFHVIYRKIISLANEIQIIESSHAKQ